MFIDKEDGDRDGDGNGNGNIISTQAPNDFKPEYSTDDLDWTCYHPYNIDVHRDVNAQLIEFINKNNQMYTGIYELVNEELFRTFTEIETYLGIIRYRKNGTILGVMLSVILDTTALTTTKFALTSYLCVHKSLRGKGLCMMLIRNMLKEAHKNGMLCSYYLQEKPFSDSALKVERWMRPINVQRSLEKGFTFEMPSQKDKFKYKHAYFINNELQSGYLYKIAQTKKDINESFKFLIEMNDTTRDKAIGWIPTKKEWKQWVKSDVFDTILVTTNVNANTNTNTASCEVCGIVTIQKKQIFIPETQQIANVGFIPYHIGHQSVSRVLLESSVLHSKHIDIDVLFIFESGIFNKETIESNKGQRTGCMYIDFYNYTNPYKPSGVYVPLL